MVLLVKPEVMGRDEVFVEDDAGVGKIQVECGVVDEVVQALGEGAQVGGEGVSDGAAGDLAQHGVQEGARFGAVLGAGVARDG